MDTTAGERERQSAGTVAGHPAARGAIVSGKMLAAVVIGIASLLLILLALKGSASMATGMGRMLDVSLPAIASLLLILLPLVVIGTGLITFVAAGAKSMKEAQSHVMWMMMLPMIPTYALMASPLKDTDLWQYAVPFLSQNQLVQKVTRGESPDAQQWAVYLGARSLGRGAGGGVALPAGKLASRRKPGPQAFGNEKPGSRRAFRLPPRIRLLLEGDGAAGGGGL
jgi:sodium transport system permease protein